MLTHDYIQWQVYASGDSPRREQSLFEHNARTLAILFLDYGKDAVFAHLAVAKQGVVAADDCALKVAF